MDAHKQITQLLEAVADGEPAAQDRLLEAIHADLHALAAAKMARVQPGQTLQATALVNEAWLRLVDRMPDRGADRGRFMTFAARAMRDILVEQARRRASAKRGGDRVRVDFELVEPAVEDVSATALEVDEVMRELEAEDPVKAEIINLRFFAGLTMAETAAILEMPLRTLEARWQFLRRWLYRRLRGQAD